MRAYGVRPVDEKGAVIQRTRISSGSIQDRNPVAWSVQPGAWFVHVAIHLQGQMSMMYDFDNYGEWTCIAICFSGSYRDFGAPLICFAHNTPPYVWIGVCVLNTHVPC